MAKVGDLEVVGEGVVTIERDQRIHVGHEIRDAGQNHGDKGHAEAERAGLHEEPCDAGHRRDHKLDPRTREGHQQAVGPPLEEPCVIGVAIQRRQEKEEHSPHVVHFSTEVLGRQPVTEFVDDDDRKDHHVGQDVIPCVGIGGIEFLETAPELRPTNDDDNEIISIIFCIFLTR